MRCLVRSGLTGGFNLGIEKIKLTNGLESMLQSSKLSEENHLKLEPLLLRWRGCSARIAPVAAHVEVLSDLTLAAQPRSDEAEDGGALGLRPRDAHLAPEGGTLPQRDAHLRSRAH